MDLTQLNDYTIRSEAVCRRNDTISPRLYDEYGVKKGLRDENGNGVLAGLTNISKITSSKIVDGKKLPCDGQLWYRGYRVEDLIGSLGETELGYEKIAYLLLMGQLPDSAAAEEFRTLLGECRTLPTNFTRDVIMKAPGKDIMNSMTRGILTLASYDERAIDTSVSNSLRQCIQLIAEFPLLAVYGYHAYNYYENMDSMVIHRPDPALSTAENLLMMLRPNKKYTATEAKVLDTALILHMEHGGGNNSTFTTHLVSSTGTDTYSAISAAVGSLKGPKHGGANLAVIHMMHDLKENVTDITDFKEVENYLRRVIRGEANDGTGLIYGLGHAVYTISDPRAQLLKKMARTLAEKNGLMDEFMLYDFIETQGSQIYSEATGLDVILPANVDLYSGFVYNALNIPLDLATPIFACARISGWCAHRIEELTCSGRIMRPAYQCVKTPERYIPLKERENDSLF